MVSGLKSLTADERWGAGVETQKNVRGEIGGWGRVPFYEPYAPSLSTIRGVGLIKFLENGTRPQPPTSPADTVRSVSKKARKKKRKSRFLRVPGRLAKRTGTLV